MSKKKKKKKSNKIIPFKSKSKPISLKERLKRVYYDTVSLDTTCSGRCECCKVAMPQMNYCEFTQLINEIWESTDRARKIDLICTSIEYFFRNEFEKWGMDTLVKPCMLLTEDGKCGHYESRPLSCRLYGIWPEKAYNERVDKFEKAYEGLLKREELPLNTQCPFVTRVDESKELTIEVINDLYEQLDKIDEKIGDFSALQISQKENYRTFHDWLLLKIFGEQWLSNLTTFMLAADKDMLIEQIDALKDAVRQQFAKDMPNIKE